MERGRGSFGLNMFHILFDEVRTVDPGSQGDLGVRVWRKSAQGVEGGTHVSHGQP